MSSSSNSNDSSTAISSQAIIVICLVGSGFVLLCAYAAGRFWTASTPQPIVDHEGPDGLTQAQYMRMVRVRNQDELQRSYGYGRPKPATFSSYDSAA